jgi:hypothetical protein
MLQSAKEIPGNPSSTSQGKILQKGAIENLEKIKEYYGCSTRNCFHF